MNDNPLRQYFRQPAIYIQLPSGGNYYPKNALEPTENGEYPVLPMTTLDEITYRTPDALFNGQAVVSVIQSCVPNIRDAWHMPGMDIDPVLVAIRIATYGHELDIDTKCPKCEHEQRFGLDLRTVLEKIERPNYEDPMRQGDLEIYFRPMSFKQMNSSSMVQFEEQKMMQAMQGEGVDDAQRMKILSDALKKITTVTTKALAQNISMVRTPQAQVTDSAMIEDWLNNCDRRVFTEIREYIVANKGKGELRPISIKCGGCGNEYSQPITLDMSNFFGAAS